MLVMGAYLWLALDHGTLWLFPTVVHESGDYTFLQTILYFRHVIRSEHTVDYLLAACLVLTTWRPTATRDPRSVVDNQYRREEMNGR